MAQKIVITQYFRIGPFANLAEPYASKPGDTAKYGITMLFPHNGITKPTGLATSNPANIIEALNAVCLEEFKIDYNTLMANHAAYGIQYPPKFIDGNQDWQKDDNKNPIIGTPRPESANMWKLSVKSADPVDLVSPNGKENLSPGQVCSGYWARAEISVDAYINREKQRVLSLKLLNLQLAYEDEKFAGGGNQKQEGVKTFGALAIADTNVAPQMNGIPPAGVVPGMQPGLPTPGMQPGMQQPGLPTPGAVMPGMQPGLPTPGMQPGLPTPGMQQPGLPTPGAVMPGMQPGLPTPGVAPGGMMPSMHQPTPGSMPQGAVPGHTPTTVPPPPPAAVPAQVQHRVIMNAGEHAYEVYKNAQWSDEQLVANGKAQWNFNYVG